MEVELKNITKNDIEKALEKLYYEPEKDYKSDNTGEEYSIVYKDSRFAIKRIYEQICLTQNQEYNNVLGSSAIYDCFVKFYDILPRLGNPKESGTKNEIITKLKQEFEEYLKEKGQNNDYTNTIDPFYLVNKRNTPAKEKCKEQDIYFFKIFENDANLEKYYEVMSQVIEKNAVSTYKYKTNKLKTFFEEKYDGFFNWIKWKGQYPSGKHTQYYVVSQRELYKEHKKEGILGATTKDEHRRIKELRPNDVVLSFHNGTIEDVIIVKSLPEEKDGNITVKVQYKKLKNAILRNEVRNKIPEKLFYRLTQYGYPFEKPQSDNDCSIKQRGYIFYFKKEVYDLLIDDKNITNGDNMQQETDTTMNPKKPTPSRNQILYGPPGTGKTYNTIVEAIKILNKDLYDKYEAHEKKYQDLKKEFNKLKQTGQIEFVTFHQSYSYEEFVEGIKPNLENSDLSYELNNGTFKRIANNALFASLDILEKDSNASFDTNEQKNLFIKKFYKKEINTIENGKPHILIIDEINRGNISKIFGELITLIEEDKRENLSATLPYSKEEFTVPKNLYILGTMNTSDRSIASIDIALRRRFKFKEMMPRMDLVADFKCNFKECFKILNERISILLDRDHQIGHSYFIEEKFEDSDTEVLKQIWLDSIIPLLNEYFYGDWEKLQAILGEAKSEKDNSSFISVKEVNNKTFAKEIDICDSESFNFNPNCNFNLAMKNAFKEAFTGEING